jgi:hypothetical protein
LSLHHNSIVKGIFWQLQVADVPISEFVVHSLTPEERKDFAPLIHSFIALFNLLKLRLFDEGRHGLAAKQTLDGNDLSYDASPAAALFPSTHDAGQCAGVLVTTLINAHNEVLRHHLDTAGIPYNKEEGMSPGAVAKAHLVVYDEKDLQLLIIANSEYDLDVEGKENTTQWKLKEEALESHVIERCI